MIDIGKIKAFKAIDVDNNEINVTLDDLAAIVMGKIMEQMAGKQEINQVAGSGNIVTNGSIPATEDDRMLADTPMTIPLIEDDRAMASSAALGADQYEDQLPQNANPAFLRGLMMDGAPVISTMAQVATVVGGQLGIVTIKFSINSGASYDTKLASKGLYILGNNIYVSGDIDIFKNNHASTTVEYIGNRKLSHLSIKKDSATSSLIITNNGGSNVNVTLKVISITE